jgi:hypothetical protein
LEADDDDNADAGGDNTTGDAASEGNEDTGATDNNDEGDNDDSGEDDFDIDTSIPEAPDVGGEGDNNDTDNSTSTPSSSSSDSDISSTSDGDEEVNKDNTEIFDTLSAEEQAIKIQELKRLYSVMYSNVSDILSRMHNIECDENTLDIYNRIADTLQELKNQINDYFNNVFSYRSYYENDVKYNQFLVQLNGIATVVDDLASSKEKMNGTKSTKTD